jgi:hypothetical protein
MESSIFTATHSDGSMRGSVAFRRICLTFASFWAVGGVLVSAGIFVVNYSVHASAPSWIAGVAVVAAFVWLPLPLVVLLLGLIHLGVDARAGWRWLSVWVAIIAAGIALQAVTLLAVGPWFLPGWTWLAISAGFLLIGMAAIAVLSCAKDRPSVP